MSFTEQLIEVPHEGFPDIPCSVWADTNEPDFVVLMGHGLGVDRYHASVLKPTEILTREHQAAVVVPEIPLHGARDGSPGNQMHIVERWQKYWANGGAQQICAEFIRVTDYCRSSFGSTVPVAYFGLSLGTQYGIVFLSEVQQIAAAVLGLFGSYPRPRTRVMNERAPRVTCPVYFIQKVDDEIHGSESTTHLFSTLGASEKVLDSTHGGHTEISDKCIRDACKFLTSHAKPRDA